MNIKSKRIIHKTPPAISKIGFLPVQNSIRNDYLVEDEQQHYNSTSKLKSEEEQPMLSETQQSDSKFLSLV